jgi:hypothetical protein
MRWQGQATVAVELWRAAGQVELWLARAWALLWMATAENPQPRIERSHCWDPPQAMLLLNVVLLYAQAPPENQGAGVSHAYPRPHLLSMVAPHAVGQPQLLAQRVVQLMPFQRETAVGDLQIWLEVVLGASWVRARLPRCERLHCSC